MGVSRSGTADPDLSFERRFEITVDLFVGYELPIVVSVFTFLFVPAILLDLYRDRPLWAGGSLRIGPDTIEFQKEGPFGGGVRFEANVEDVQQIQLTSIQEPSIREQIDPDRNREITVVTSGDLQVVARGLKEGEAKRLVEDLRRAIPQLRSDESES